MSERLTDTTVPTPFALEEGADVFNSVEWDTRLVEIKNPTTGEVLFSQQVEAPTDWSDQSVQIVASKYFLRRPKQRYRSNNGWN